MNHYLIAVPLRGLHLSNSGSLPSDLFERRWTLVAQQQFSSLQKLHNEAGGLGGNLRVIQKRLDPDSILLYQVDDFPVTHDTESCYDEADTIIAALCVASLLRDRAVAPNWHGEPLPVFRARYREHCDLPLVFDTKGIVSSGHTSTLGWASVGQHGFEGLPPSAGQIVRDARAASVPTMHALECAAPSTPFEAELIAAMRRLTAAFQATSIGQFAAGAIAAIEELVGKDEQWQIKSARMHALVGAEYAVKIDQVIRTRHDFVHEARQPLAQHGYLALTALALAVQVWGRLANLLDRVYTLEDLSYFLRGLSGTSPLALPLGPAERIEWIDRYLR